MDPEKQATMVEHSESKGSEIKTGDDPVELDPLVERRLLRKLDAVVLPLLALSYLVAYMVSTCSCTAAIPEAHLCLAGP